MKEQIESTNSKKTESSDQIKDSDAVSKLKKENEILKHELEITNLKMSLMEDEKKSQSDLRSENVDLKSKLTASIPCHVVAYIPSVVHVL